MLQRDGLQYSGRLHHDRGASTARCNILLADRQRPTMNWVHIERTLTTASVTGTVTEATSRKSEAIEI
jgi:hypothetical protein